jgi:N-acetylmuramoyl-L-alanine amidase
MPPHQDQPFSKIGDKDNQIADNGYQIRTIVLDAGHGGRDRGCSGKSSKEKHIALNVVLKLGQTIEQYFPTVKVIYTRKTDVFVPLYERAAIANRNNADLFISIHCNALSKKAHLVNGSETYVMGLHTAEHNLEVARRENESILLEEDYEKNYQGFDPNSDEGHIFLSMFQNAFLDKSILFAEKVESNIKYRARRRSRGVKQAGFVVLKETTMPSVLIETGYLTNAKDEAFLKTNAGQEKMANAIFEAFKAYKLEVEKEEVFTPVAAPALAQNETPATITSRTEEDIIVKKHTPVIPPQKEMPKAIPTKLIVSKNRANLEEVKPIPAPVPAPNKVVVPVSPKVVFKIQLAASPNELETSNKKWSKIQYVEVRKEKSLYKYLTGNHEQYEAALVDRNKILQQGFNGAFIVAYKDGKRISLKEAKEQ